ncbi:hypothetical protein E3A20_03440 [Planctomyces bekefii]|uniref:Tetratricopeptide repeat protein n=1 Tax=Planctomyces bekefii TaxID=1653850 RepID=A0A5C6MBT8_9PLAN|nr:hypothetical protein E3A20_03440 [Planctomyces bekefii]
MEKLVEKKLEQANKLIFVKRYHDAEKLIDDVLASPDGHSELLVHLRRIELSAMLKKVEKTRSHYLKQIKAGKAPEINEIALALTEQHGEVVSPQESISVFQELLKKYGNNPATFYGIAYSMEQQGNFDRAIYNYEQSIAADSSWYISYFGMSQVYYQMGDEKRGDHYFYLFESAAPFNVYGNFETHRRLCQEFSENERFDEAETAIQALSEWWLDNKGTCPLEIQIYELLSTAKIAAVRGDQAEAETRRTRANGLALQALDDPHTTENVLYFIAKVLEEFDDFTAAFKFYKRILKAEGGSPAMVQKIGSQFLALGEYALARELFVDAYEVHPENPDVRFCLLVSNLKLAEVNVEEYLIGRERLRQLVESGGDKVELLALLHSLIAKFAGDAEVQGHIGDVYLRLGNIDRAARHYEVMYQIDGKARPSALKYAAFVMQNREPDKAMEVLSRISDGPGLSADHQAEVYWLKSNYFARKRNFRESLQLLRKVLALDPWNVSYLVQEVINLVHLAPVDDDLKKVDKALVSLTGNTDEHRLDWSEFDQATLRFEKLNAHELVYARRKLRYLYANGSDASLSDLVAAACKHDASRATYDFMKLLNTNFDSPNIYWALGIIFKELWQLETASVWFEQMLLYPGVSNAAKSKACLELADCLIWQGKNQRKAVELAQIALDLDERKDARGVRVLAHAFLKAGEVRQAKIYLEQGEGEMDPETRYLRGLVEYRNGSRAKANEIWKPLLTVRSESLRFHNIKQEVLKFYFDGVPYLKAN